MKGAVYVSTGGVTSEKITERVRSLAEQDFKYIELTGGTLSEERFLVKLQALKATYGLSFLVHNYFPPPKIPFVFNLASTKKEIRELSIKLACAAIDICVELEAPIYSFHAGFFFDPSTSELGGAKRRHKLVKPAEGINYFVDSYCLIQEYSEKKGIQIFVENNVLDSENYNELGCTKAAMLLDNKDYERLFELIGFNLLLDTGHLKVSAKTLGLPFAQQFKSLAKKAGFLQISDNNNKKDQNRGVLSHSQIHSLLNSIALEDKWLSLEVYEDMQSIRETKTVVEKLIQGKRVNESRST
jgi:sugar phosphate isomerase/epimerase